MRFQKKKLLLSYGNPYVFRDSIAKIIPILSNSFRIWLITTDYYLTNDIHNYINKMKSNDILQDFLVLPQPKDTFKLFILLQSNQKFLSSINFDIFLTGDDMQLISRFLMDCVVPKKCLRVILFLSPAYLFFRDINVAKQLVSAYRNKQRLPKHLIESIPTVFTEQDLETRNFDRNVLAPLFFGKAFPFGPYDNLTQMSSGRSDVILMNNEEEADAHKILFNMEKIYAVEYPTAGSCQCNQINKERRSILLPSPLSSYANRISKNIIEEYFRDVKNAMKESGAASVHLRPHPADQGNLTEEIKKYFVINGIQAEIKMLEKPIRNIICSYLGIAGLLSTSFLDARAACEYAFVVGFESISNIYFSNINNSDPISLYERVEGIYWIKTSGHYNPKIFQRVRHIPSKKPSIPEILVKLSQDN